MTVKLNTNFIPGEINIESNASCKITRCVYHFQPSNFLPCYCLLRIFEFKSKIIVIASQLKGAILWDEILIKYIIEDFELDCENIYWINHVGLFSDLKLAKERFIHTTFTCKKSFVFSRIEINLQKEYEIDLGLVQTLIERTLEPVEILLGLDYTADVNLSSKREEITLQLLHLYIQENIEYFCKQEEIIKILASSQPGAIFFYPNKDKAIEFIEYEEISSNNNDLKQKALPYIAKSYPSKEIVICIYIDDYAPFCTVLKKESFLQPFKITSISVEKLVECALESPGYQEFDLERYKEKKQTEKERLHGLLKLYLEPNIDYLKYRFDQARLIYDPKSKTLRGALFYHPQSNYYEFSPLKEFTHKYKNLAVPYIETYNVETEFVVCICFDMDQSVCGIFPK